MQQLRSGGVADLITTRELARALRVSESAVRTWVREGKITPELTTPGGQHRFVLADVLAEIKRNRAGRDDE